ncbi:MAG: hypothetical protein V1929_05895 [bacterium]
MSKSLFEIGADGVDAEKIVREIQETVARKSDEGAYADARVARAERANLANLRDDEEFLAFYLRSLHEASFIDINDFDIRERRETALAPLLVRLKKTIWSLLRFYTYRLWSQQNNVNGLLVTGIETLDEKYGQKIKQLEARVAQLEGRSPPSS